MQTKGWRDGRSTWIVPKPRNSTWIFILAFFPSYQYFMLRENFGGFCFFPFWVMDFSGVQAGLALSPSQRFGVLEK